MLIVAFALAACASGSSVITGTKRPAIAPSAVQLYTNPPAEYDVIGIVKASSDAGLTEQGSMDYALEELKRQAAAIGANGVLLRAVGERGGAYYGTYVPNAHSGGYFVGSESLAQTLSGEAIYVLKKE
jgi:hypothetical protein